MPKFVTSVPHGLSQEEATERVKRFLERIREKYGEQVSDLQEEWGENRGSFSFKTYGFNVKGNLLVEQEQVKVEGDLPFAAMMFKGRIESTIKENLERLLT